MCQKTLAEKALNPVFKIRKQTNFCHLSLRSANKIFDTAIQPILTCGSDVWCLYIQTETNFDNWDRTPIEKTNLRFCGMFLEVNKRAANHATRAEMGRFPIQSSIISLIFQY